MRSAGDQIRRLLLVIPYAARHPGVRLSVLAEKLGVSPARLGRDLERLCCIGQPPFCPDDLIDVEVSEGRVFVHLAQNFTHPPRLTLREASALWANLQRAMPLFRRSLVKTRARLTAALAARERADFDRVCQQLIAEETPIDGLLAKLSKAIRALGEVRFEELIVERVQSVQRLVEPWSLCERKGRWLLDGFSVRERAPRTFRVDRLSALAFTGRRFQRRGERAFVGAPLAPALIEADEALVSWILENLAATELDWCETPGRRVFEIRLDDRAEFARLVASLGGRAKVLSPGDLAREVAEVALGALENHRGERPARWALP